MNIYGFLYSSQRECSGPSTHTYETDEYVDSFLVVSPQRGISVYVSEFFGRSFGLPDRPWIYMIPVGGRLETFVKWRGYRETERWRITSLTVCVESRT